MTEGEDRAAVSVAVGLQEDFPSAAREIYSLLIMGLVRHRKPLTPFTATLIERLRREISA